LRATGPDDVLHYAWSTVGYPTVFISRSSLDSIKNKNDCTSNFHVNNYKEFLTHQTAGSVSIDDVTDNFSFALIFKSLVEFKVNTKKLPTTSAFHPDQLQKCYDERNCHVYYLNNNDLKWSSYDPDMGIKAKDDTSDFTVTLKVRIFSKLFFVNNYVVDDLIFWFLG